MIAPAVARRDLADLGAAAAASEVTLTVTLNYRNQASLDRLVQLQATPTSPLFHHFLTPAAFADRFAPSPLDYARVASALRGAGFRVARVYENRTVIDVTGSVAAAEDYFHTKLHLFNQKGHGARYANVMPITLPAALAGSVKMVLRLDNVVKFKVNSRRIYIVPVAQGEPEVTSSSAPIERKTDGEFAGLYPTGTAKAYHFPSQSGFTGTGHAIAVVMDSDIAQSDLKTFWNAAGIKRTGTFSRVLVDGNNPGVGCDVGETAIDTETTSSLAPGANVYLYLIADLSDGPIEDAYNLAVSRRVEKLDVVSSSFGGCELDDTSSATAIDAIAEQGASEGITFAASSGDEGGFCEDQTSSGQAYYQPDIVEGPAPNPHFLAVGATALKVNANTGARTSETAWSPGGPDGGSGGGVSSFWKRPSYQNGVHGIRDVPDITVQSPDTQPNGGFAGRNLPDISLNGSNAVGSYIAVYDSMDGGWTGYGGTSVSCPEFAALIADQNQKTKSRAGFLNVALYATFIANGSKPAGMYGTDFHDIVKGETGAHWSAVAGYDQSKGIGSIQDGAF